jgi:hypothetical protein
MSHENLAATRRSLHGIAELVLAGPQYAAARSIRLRATPGGFGTTTAPDLRVQGTQLVMPDRRLPLQGSYADLARAAGVEPRALRDVYDVGPGVAEDDLVEVDAEAAEVVHEAFSRADAALRSFAPDSEPVIWPEHFDIGISVDETNYGVSPGDTYLDEPYAYVGPWSPRTGAFWNAPFGAARPLSELPDVESLARFFQEGARRARD